jgi:hypothetical protein
MTMVGHHKNDGADVRVGGAALVGVVTAMACYQTSSALPSGSFPQSARRGAADNEVEELASGKAIRVRLVICVIRVIRIIR